jgi:hypothetical protein
MDKVERVGDIKRLKISDIIIGDRFRTNFDDMDSFALSLNIKGQQLPIIVDLAEGKKYKLVEGERRIRALKMNGETMVDAITLNTLSDVDRMELELLHSIQRENFDFMTEARATKKIVEARRRAGNSGGMAKFGRGITNKEVAVELAMTESRMSENIRIANALDDRPELEAIMKSRTKFLREIRTGSFFVPDGGAMQSTYQENFIITTPLGCMDTINDKIIDLAILHPDKIELELFMEIERRLKLSGQIIIFCSHADCYEWEKILKNNGMNVGPRPYIWHIKGEEDYQNFLWAGRNMLSPNKPLQNMISAARPLKSLHPKAKPMQLMSNIIKCCSDRGAFVVIPDCPDIETVRACVETGRNVRAATSNKILRDKLILSVTKTD